MDDLISKQRAIDAARDWYEGLIFGSFKRLEKRLRALPSAQSERDIPKKPTATTDKSWGIPHRQAVCPNCDCFLGTVYFICDGNSKRKVTYCESCGQAIDWEGWEFETD